MSASVDSKELERAIREDVMSSFESEEIKEFKSFEAFFDQVDTLNAYEEGWDDRKELDKPTYKKVYNFLKGVTK